MKMDQFVDQLLAAAAQAGIETAEAYYEESSSFSAEAMDSEIKTYEVSSGAGLSLRGTVGGKMGYASTQAFDDAAIDQLIEGVKESAALVESEEQDEIFAGEEKYPEIAPVESDIDAISAEEKLAFCLNMEKATKAADERVWKVEGSQVSTATTKVSLRNSYGLNLSNASSYCVAYTGPIVKDGDFTTTAYQLGYSHKFADLDAEKLGREATAKAIAQLHGAPVEAGEYRVILRNDAMGRLLATFAGIFSAESAQQNMSLLAGKEGTKIASDMVTLMDDPLLPGGFATCAFDAEGSASRTKAVIDGGTLTTLLHSRKTARKQGVTTTGNAQRASYTSPVHVAPTNFFLKPGEKTLEAMTADLGDGLVITEVGGLHAGANPVSGDFSLIAKGYTVENGQRGRAVEQITVAGNFYELLKNIRAVGCDLLFEGSSVGSPSVDAGVLKISGK